MFKVIRINHIAIATRNPNKHLAFFRDTLHIPTSPRLPQPEHGVYTTFFDLPGTKVELLEELGDNSPITAFLNRKADGGIHHVCYEVDNLEMAVAELRKAGVRTLGEEGVRIGAHGKPVVFLHPKDTQGILTELEQA